MLARGNHYKMEKQERTIIILSFNKRTFILVISRKIASQNIP